MKKADSQYYELDEERIEKAFGEDEVDFYTHLIDIEGITPRDLSLADEEAHAELTEEIDNLGKAWGIPPMQNYNRFRIFYDMYVQRNKPELEIVEFEEVARPEIEKVYREDKLHHYKTLDDLLNKYGGTE